MGARTSTPSPASCSNASRDPSPTIARSSRRSSPLTCSRRRRPSRHPGRTSGLRSMRWSLGAWPRRSRTGSRARGRWWRPRRQRSREPRRPCGPNSLRQLRSRRRHQRRRRCRTQGRFRVLVAAPTWKRRPLPLPPGTGPAQGGRPVGGGCRGRSRRSWYWVRVPSSCLGWWAATRSLRPGRPATAGRGIRRSRSRPLWTARRPRSTWISGRLGRRHPRAPVARRSRGRRRRYGRGRTPPGSAHFHRYGG